jgi:hypothetical protein
MGNNMFFKYYTADVIEVDENKSIEVGSVMCWVWFFHSPNFAYDLIVRSAGQISAKYEIKNFRRVK